MTQTELQITIDRIYIEEIEADTQWGWLDDEESIKEELAELLKETK